METDREAYASRSPSVRDACDPPQEKREGRKGAGIPCGPIQAGKKFGREFHRSRLYPIAAGGGIYLRKSIGLPQAAHVRVRCSGATESGTSVPATRQMGGYSIMDLLVAIVARFRVAG